MENKLGVLSIRLRNELKDHLSLASSDSEMPCFERQYKLCGYIETHRRSEEEILLRNYGTCDLTYKPDERDSHGRILVRRPSSTVIIPPAHEVVVPLSGAICINGVPKVRFSFRRYPTDDHMKIKKD